MQESRPTPSDGNVPLTVVMPAYNEEDGIEAAVREAAEQVLDRVPGAELVVVDDGSRDGTGALLDELARREPRLRVLHKPNGGHGSALLAGLAAAQGDFILLIDSDRQIPLCEFAAPWSRRTDIDAALGVRRDRQDAPLRLWLSAVIRAALRLLFGIRTRDANAPFKLVRRTLWAAARPFIPEGTLAPSLFLSVYALQSKRRVWEFEVAHRQRATGAGLGHRALLRFCLRASVQLTGLRTRLRGGAA